MAIRDYTKQKDFNLDTIDVRLKSTPNYVKYLKHLSSVQLGEGEMNTYNVLQMVISDLEKSNNQATSKEALNHLFKTNK